MMGVFEGDCAGDGDFSAAPSSVSASMLSRDEVSMGFTDGS